MFHIIWTLGHTIPHWDWLVWAGKVLSSTIVMYEKWRPSEVDRNSSGGGSHSIERDWHMLSFRAVSMSLASWCAINHQRLFSRWPTHPLNPPTAGTDRRYGGWRCRVTGAGGVELKPWYEALLTVWKDDLLPFRWQNYSISFTGRLQRTPTSQERISSSMIVQFSSHH